MTLYFSNIENTTLILYLLYSLFKVFAGFYIIIILSSILTLETAADKLYSLQGALSTCSGA